MAIIVACKKWDLWLYGRGVTVHTDHQPLESIFRKPLKTAPRWLQKMMMCLQRYCLCIIYKKGTTLLLADTLLRSTTPDMNPTKQANFQIFRIALESDSPEHQGITSKTLSQVRQATASDPESIILMSTIIHGWPNHKSLADAAISEYWTYRDELSVSDGIIYKGNLVLIPPSLRKLMLERIHVSHFGPESNLRLCRDIVFWLGMRADIVSVCDLCTKCTQFKPQHPREPMASCPVPTYPWQFVSQDLFSLSDTTYLATVNHYSDFLEIDKLDNTWASTVAAKTEAQWARHGVLEIILTHNGPQFIAGDYEGLCHRYNVTHITSSPYWPQGNGKAESAVKISKRFLQKCGREKLQEALLAYRNSPPQGHHLSPAQRCMGLHTRGLLPMARKL